MNAVKWVPEREEGEEIIVSGSVDHSVRIWKENNGEVACLDGSANESFRNVKSFQIILDQ